MPRTKYIKVKIDDQELDLPPANQVSIGLSYHREDLEDFQTKKSSEAPSVKIPATPANDLIANTFHNPGVEDMTLGSVFKSARKGVIEESGQELLVGKAFLRKATHDHRPLGYEFDFLGNNGDWIIDLKETTLFDFLQKINFTFTKPAIMNSWLFDGRSEAQPFVFAPVRYGLAMDNMTVGGTDVADLNMKPEYMRPSLSKYWLIYWAFKSLGYQIKSDFFDTDFFRRQVMPWTWGNFLYSDGTRLTNLDFLAKSAATQSMIHTSFTGIWDLVVTNDNINGAFDNNNSYTYDGVNKLMKWTYLNAFSFGRLEAHFHLQVFVDAVATANSDVELRVQYFKNGNRVISHDDNGNGTQLVNLHAPNPGRREFKGLVDDFFVVPVDPGDIISAKFYLHTFDSSFGVANIQASVDAFELDYFRIPMGGLIDFQNYTGFKKYKFLDFLRGVVDEFDLSVETDPQNKIVYFEPSHEYSLTSDPMLTRKGYFNGDFLDWNDKQDVSKVATMENYSDHEREVTYKYSDDTSDGALKVVQDRYVTVLGSSKFVFPDRFKTGQREYKNRFFSPTMHYMVEQWKYITNETAQMICLVPENVSNTSRDEAQNTFAPKSAFYKGLEYGTGWVFDGAPLNNFPFMFAVNYKIGGEDDPILSYSDEKIGSGATFAIGKGLFRRFYLQRFANMRNGQNYTTFFKLNNLDITNWLHREFIICRGQRWELIDIKNYFPLEDQSTECFLRRSVPVNQMDSDNVFPSPIAVMNVVPATNAFDLKYSPLKCLPSDIPK